MALMEGSGERGAFSRSKGACQAVWPGKCRPLALVKPAGYGAKPSSCVLSSVAGLASASVVRAGGHCGSWAGSPYDSPRAMGVQTSAAVAGEGYGPCRAGQAQGTLVPSLTGQLSRASGILVAPQLSLPCQWLLLRSSLPLQLTASPRIVQKRFKH